ncbi:MAG: hypothetical protein BVN35_06115 [Proteobacteria bacterium ST_bin11]|nr:MAG: hypothetical protein BVN35_06115 [Proteobacteria bacterium ST_bin11]
MVFFFIDGNDDDDDDAAVAFEAFPSLYFSVVQSFSRFSLFLDFLDFRCFGVLIAGIFSDFFFFEQKLLLRQC